MLKNALTFDPKRPRPILGNYVIASSADAFAAFAHLVPGSVRVAAGEVVSAGDEIGKVGHTGNSTAPHLHCQLMDSPDALTARGIACAFWELRIERDGRWATVRDVISRRADRIGSVAGGGR